MIGKIRNKLKSKDNKILLENFISLSFVRIFGMIVPLITLPYIIRVLGTSHYGIIVLAVSLINYFSAITDFSFTITATRDVAVFRHSQRKLNLIYSKVITIKTLLFLFSALAITVVVLTYPPFYKEKLVFFLTLPMLLGNTIFPEWFFQGIERMRYITILNVSVKLFFTCCVFLFIHKRADYWIYPLLQSLGFIGAGIIGQVIMVRKYKLKFHWIKPGTIVRTLKSNFPIFVNQFMPTLYNNSSTFLLGVLTNTSFAGMYDAIKKIIDMFSVLVGILSRVFFPFLNRKNDAFPKYRKMMLSLGLVLSLVPIIFYKPIFWYLDIYFEYAFLTLVFLSLGIFGLVMYDVFGLNFLIIKRKDKEVMKNTFFASLTGFVLAFPLVIFFGIAGAALNLTFTRFLMGLGLYRKYKLYAEKDI